jgi:hypothetical protein
MTLRLIPDAEALVGDWLREHPAVVALDANVAGRTPTSMSKPWVRVTQLDARAVGGLEHLIRFPLQLDCYAGREAMDAGVGQAEAKYLARTVRSILTGLAGATIDGVTVTHVRVLGDMRAPDTTLEPARERVVLTVEVSMHAAVA